jgi:hypothetical protein
MSSADTVKTIDLGGGSIQREAVAAGTIRPGMLVLHTTTVVAHGGAGLVAAPAFAVENEHAGKGIDDNYVTGDNVIYRVFQEGARVNALLASGQNVAAGALLQSNGAGALTVASTADNVVARAVDAVDASSGIKRIRVQITKGYTSA